MTTRVLFVLLITIVASTLSTPTFGDEPRHPWDLPIGTGFLLRSDDGNLSTYYEVVDIVETDAGIEYHVTTTIWHGYLYKMHQVHLEALDGNIYLTEAEDLVTGDKLWYDPPILYLELPLHPGQQFEAKSTFYRTSMPEGEFQHHRFTVDEVDFETPAGTFKALRMTDDPIAGTSNGVDYFVAGLGMVGTINGTTGELRRLISHTNGLVDESLGWGEEVTPTFGWKPGMAWRVHRRSVIDMDESSENEPIRGNYEYTIAAEMLPTDMLIRRGDFEIPIEYDPAEFGDDLNRLLDLTALIKTRHVVDEEGHFQALASKKKQEESARQLMEAFNDVETEGKAAELQELLGPLASMINPQLLEQGAATEWNYMVGNWTGRTFSLGKVQSLTYSNPYGLMFGRDIPMNAILMATGRCPCDDDDDDNDCLEIMLSGASGDIPGLEHITLSSSVSIVLDPEGMFPRQLNFLDRTKIEGHPTVPDQYIAGYEFLRFEELSEGGEGE